MSNSEDFISRLQKALVNAGLTQSSLARKLATPVSTVQRWFSGSLPRSRMIDDLCQVLKVDQRWLLTGQGDMDPETTHSSLREEPAAFGVGLPGMNLSTLSDANLVTSIRDCLDALQQQPSEVVRRTLADTGIALFREIAKRSSQPHSVSYRRRD